MYDWNDLRVFIAVAKHGSTLAASKVLKINQTTVARRLEALEGDLGLKLFERGQSGSRLTEAGEDLIGEAERVEKAAEALASRAAAHQRGMAGTIRVTASEAVSNMVLIPAVAEFRRMYPEVTIELAITDDALSIEDGEADVALRAGGKLPDSDLVSRKLSEISFGLYCSRSYADAHGVPTRAEELKRHSLIGPDGARIARLPGYAFMLEHAGDAEIRCRANTLTSLQAAIKAGLGIGPMATTIAEPDPDLVRCIIPEGAFINLWLLTRSDLKDVPRIRAFIDFAGPFIHTMSKDYEARARHASRQKTQAAAPEPQTT